MKKIDSLELKLETFENLTLWKIGPRSDPSFWNESNDDLPETENKTIETDPVKERKGVHYYLSRVSKF